MFVPVIFASGRDDDLPGIVAALKNEAVQYGDRIYKPDENITVDGHREGNGALCLSCDRLYILGPDQDLQSQMTRHGWLVPTPQSVVVRCPDDMQRHVLISNNDIHMSWRAQG